MTQERLMERLWLLLQPYGWELRCGYLYKEVEIIQYHTHPFYKQSENDHVVFKIAFNLIETEIADIFVRRMSCDIDTLVLNGYITPKESRPDVCVEEDRLVCKGNDLYHFLEDIVKDIMFCLMRSEFMFNLKFELTKDIDEETLNFDLLQEDEARLAL